MRQPKWPRFQPNGRPRLKTPLLKGAQGNWASSHKNTITLVEFVVKVIF
jgi:hypothetical protein